MSNLEKQENIKLFKEMSLNEQKKYIKEKSFKKSKKYLLNELQNQKNKNIDLKLFIETLKNTTSSIINFSGLENKKIKADTLPWVDICFYTKFFKNADKEWIDLNMYHELRHFIWLDNLNYNKELLSNNNFEFLHWEMAQKIATFRKYMKENNYSINKKWLEEIFKKIKDENENWINRLSPNSEIDLFAIYNNFKYNKKDLLFYLQNLVKLEELKKETQNT